MRKIISALVILLTLGACFPLPIPGLATPTAVIVTTQAPPSPIPSPLPSATPVLANPTATVPPTSPASLSETPTLVPTIVDLTATFATATEVPSNSSATPSQPTTVPGLPTASPTLGIRLYGTLPPEVPFNEITIINRARAEAYISLQVTLNDGRYSILEYPVPRRVKVKAPLGSYLFVAWVGGNKMVGTFRLDGTGGLTIYLYRDRVDVR
jgi:hypothetical protein